MALVFHNVLAPLSKATYLDTSCLPIVVCWHCSAVPVCLHISPALKQLIIDQTELS